MRTADTAGRRTRVRARVLVQLSDEDVAAVDRWAEASDLESRSGAIRALVRRALKAANASQAEKASA